MSSGGSSAAVSQTAGSFDHDAAAPVEPAAASGSVLALDFGKMITSGSPQEVATHPEVVRSYLG